MINMAHTVGSMVNIRKGVLDQFSNPRAWKWCARILCLTALKLEVHSDEEAGVSSVYPPGEVTAHQLVAVEWETGFSGAGGGCNSDRWGPSPACAGNNSQRKRTDCPEEEPGKVGWGKDEGHMLRWVREEKRMNFLFSKDQEGEEDLSDIFGMVLCQDLRRPSRRRSVKRIWTPTWVGSVEDTSVWKNR